MMRALLGLDGQPVALKPQDISGATLPGAMRGYSRAATDDLLKRVAWDFLQLSHDRDTLFEESARLKERNEELEQQVAALHELLSRQVDREDVSRVLLTNAQRTARELRDATRRECELALKKARERAASLQQSAQLELKGVERDLTELAELREDLHRRLRQSIETIMGGREDTWPQRPDLVRAEPEATDASAVDRSPAPTD
jgi:cell division septum initiation protein DivIVA